VAAAWQWNATRVGASRFPPPGRLVDVGGRRLHLLCAGRGAPTVILEPSGLGVVLQYQAVMTALAPSQRVCAHDRAGQGWSDPSPDPADAWHKGNSKGRTHDGAELKANALGLYDLIGNVWEYALEPYAASDYNPVIRGGCWSSVPRELRFANRQTIPLKWFADDSNLPRSVWWLTAHEVSIGFRVACAADASDAKEREAYAARVEIAFTGNEEKTLKTGNSPAIYRTVRGTVKNAGDRDLDEVEIKVFYLESDGSTPHWIDQAGAKPGRAVFSKVWPVLANSALGGGTEQPLKPGESRAFSVDLPLSYDVENGTDVKLAFGGKTTALRFSK
jgi:hypothetical protein